MENETKKEKDYTLISSVIIVIVLIAGAFLYTIRFKRPEALSHPARLSVKQQSKILQSGIELPVKWGNLGVQMIETGVIDREKFEALYSGRGGLSEVDQKLLTDIDNGNLVITSENSGMILNMFWALGLGNKNPILETGEMMNPAYDGAGNFASTGGWTLSKGNAMDHYSMHQFFVLTDSQQALVDKVSRGIYRPCCGNSTHFPDCNHGMAMLGLLELMASQGVPETEMYKVALEVNILWFPGQYEAIKTYFASQNIDWNIVDPKEILGINYSSASGYKNVLSQIQPQEQKNGTSCGA